MTIAQMRRKWPSLIRKAEKSTRMKFRRKPVLKLDRHYPSTDMTISRNRKYVRKIHVHVSKRMVRENPKLAEVCLLHELREALYVQQGYSPRQADLKAQKREVGDMQRAGFGDRKKLGWLLRSFYHRKVERGSFRLMQKLPWKVTKHG